MVNERGRHTATFKLRVALKTLEGSKTICHISSAHEIHSLYTSLAKATSESLA